MKLTAKRLARCALLSALALALSYFERALPLPLLVPLPGVKLGLANLVTVFALCVLSCGDALAILLTRCFLGALFAGNVSALLYSLLGGLCALGATAALYRSRRFSLYGLCIGGAAAHNVGQVLAAMALLASAAPLYYLPFLLLVSLFTGALSGFLSSLLLRAAEAIRLDTI